MKKFLNLQIKIKSYIKSIFYYVKNNEQKSDRKLNLNLGCGQIYRDGWINVDIDKSVRTDICCDFIHLKNHFKTDTLDLIYMIHSISYLNLWESILFFEDAYELLKTGGVLELEFPDIQKCSKIIIENSDNGNYIEAVRAIYAFDLNQIKNKEVYKPYAFGWSGLYMKETLHKIGFSQVDILEPETHEKRNWRDTRIIAIK